jgi:hypothetical protein
MSYYQGDYYRGGFFSFIGGLAKSVLGLGGGGTKTVIMQPAGPANPPGAALSRIGQLGQAGMALARKHPVLSAAAAAGLGAAGLGAGALMRRGKGVHPAVAAAMGGGGRRRKRINVCNPRALRRAIRRTHGFARLAMKTIHLVHPKKKARFGGFRRKRKRAA